MSSESVCNQEVSDVTTYIPPARKLEAVSLKVKVSDLEEKTPGLLKDV
jgi:hypothetical protein